MIASGGNLFYRELEERFRGSRDLVLSRLSTYKVFLEPLVAEGDARALDLGCGRGEWLELARELGLDANGVDLDLGMLAAARERRLPVTRRDAITALRSVPDGDLAVVSAFHLAEHIPFDKLRALFNEARRALRPGGILIVETPNPENLLVSLVNFHLDPTHHKPIPPQLMGFLSDHAGFARHVTMRLNGSPPDHEAASDLAGLLTEVSLDYAVVAQKAGPTASALDSAFAQSSGLDLAGFVTRFDRTRSQRLKEIANWSAGLNERIVAHEHALTQVREDIRAEIAAMRSELAILREEALFRLETQIAVQESALDDIRELTGIELAASRSELASFREETLFHLNRPWIEKLFFRPSGKPKRAIRKLLFHNNGRPRRMFVRWVFDNNGAPLGRFQRWIESPSYQTLPWPTHRRRATERVHFTAAQRTWPGEFDPTNHPLRAELIAQLETEAVAARKVRQVS